MQYVIGSAGRSTHPTGAKPLTAPNWVRRPEAAARTLVRRTATLGAAVARTVGAQEIAAIASFESKNDATRDVVAVEVLQLGQLEGGVKTRLRAMERVTEIPYVFSTGWGRLFGRLKHVRPMYSN